MTNEEFAHSDFTFKEGLEFEQRNQTQFNGFYNQMGWTYDRSCNCKEYDLSVEIEHGIYKIEEKFRPVDYNDFLIEIIQNVINLDKGWYYTTSADYINYMVEGKKLYKVNWKKFKQWFIANWKTINTKMKPSISCKGYGLTVNISMPWCLIPSDIYELYHRASSKQIPQTEFNFKL